MAQTIQKLRIDKHTINPFEFASLLKNTNILFLSRKISTREQFWLPKPNIECSAAQIISKLHQKLDENLRKLNRVLLRRILSLTDFEPLVYELVLQTLYRHYGLNCIDGF